MLRDMEPRAYYVDENLLSLKLDLARRTFHAIWRWANKLKGRLKVGAPYVLLVSLF